MQLNLIFLLDLTPRKSSCCHGRSNFIWIFAFSAQFVIAPYLVLSCFSWPQRSFSSTSGSFIRGDVQMTSALRGREGVSQNLMKGREVAWIWHWQGEGGGPKFQKFRRCHMYMPPFLTNQAARLHFSHSQHLFSMKLVYRHEKIMKSKWCEVPELREALKIWEW